MVWRLTDIMVANCHPDRSNCAWLHFLNSQGDPGRPRLPGAKITITRLRLLPPLLPLLSAVSCLTHWRDDTTWPAVTLLRRLFKKNIKILQTYSSPHNIIISSQNNSLSPYSSAHTWLGLGSPLQSPDTGSWEIKMQVLVDTHYTVSFQ